jgi:hypothetical protein
MSMVFARIALCLFVVSHLAACDHVVPGCGSIDGRPGTCADGDACMSSLDCTSSNCADGTCTPSCASAADCPSGSICLSVDDPPGMRRFCSDTCPTSTFHVIGDTGGLVCFERILQHCVDLPDPGPVCDTCRCHAGDRCLDPEGVECRLAASPCTCVAPAPVGSPCTSNVGCISFNCSGNADSASRHCQVAAGTDCDASTDCIHCDVPAATGGGATCRQSCERDADCAGGICAALGDPHEPACYLDCTLDGNCGGGVACTPLPGDPRARFYCAPQ